MASILLRVPVGAEPSAVYEAVATNEGVRSWWSSQTDGPEGLGSVMKVSFPDAPITFDFEVTEDVRDERVVWRCLQGPPEWIDTDVRLEIQIGEDGSQSVLFTHDGWKTTEDSFPFIAYSWAQILPRLKILAESGKADPYFNF